MFTVCVYASSTGGRVESPDFMPAVPLEGGVRSTSRGSLHTPINLVNTPGSL